jgi:hypothetical protein
VIEGSVRVKGDQLVTTLWAIDGRTGRSKRPCHLTGLAPEDLAIRAADCLLRCLNLPREA